MFHDDDDFMDDYYEYKMFENSMKQSEPQRKAGQGKPTSPPPMRMTKKSSDLGCGGWISLICVVIAAISIFGSCENRHKSSYNGTSRSSYSSSSRSYSSGYNSSSNSKAYSSTKPSSGSTVKSYSGNSSKSKSTSDPYDAKSYAHPDDLYYDHPDDFWDYADAEEYWEEQQSD